MARKTGDETPQALKAYLDYEAMGDERSLPKLGAMYRERSAKGEPVPTVRDATLGRWSSEHEWQARIKAFNEREAELDRRKRRARADRQRERIMLGIEVGTSKFLQAIDEGKATLIEDIGDLATGAKLYFQVAGEPLADRQEHTGANGAPMQVQTIPLPIFGPQDPLNHFDQEPEASGDDDDPGD